ncbi:MAG: 50S ribosomal protein L10 [archaeon]
MAHVSDEKKKIVKEFTELLNKYSIIGAVNMENLPAKQLQNMREQLRDKLVMKMTKRRLMKIAIDGCKKPGIQALKEQLKGMPALIFTNENPFTLFKFIKKNKSKAPIKAGQIAPNDLVVPAGPTGFAPGPVIGELGAFRIKSGVEDGKVVVKEDSTVAKEGDIVNAKLAALLTRLGVEPMEIGLDLVAVYENGEIVPKSVLDIDEEAYMNNLRTAASESFNLAMFAAYPAKETIELLLGKAHNDSKALATDQDILTDETVGISLGKAEGQMNALKTKLNIQIPEKAAPKAEEAPKEEPKAEEKKPEKPKVEKKEEPKAEEKPAEEKQVEEEKPEEKVEAKEEAPAPAAPETPPEAPEEPKVEEKVEEKKEPEPAAVPEAAEKPAEEEVKPEALRNQEVSGALETQSVSNVPKEEPKVEEKKEEAPKEKTPEERKKELSEASGAPQSKLTDEDIKVAEAKLKELHQQRMDGMSFEKKAPEKIPTAHELAEKKAQKEAKKKKEEIEKAKKG